MFPALSPRNALILYTRKISSRFAEVGMEASCPFIVCLERLWHPLLLSRFASMHVPVALGIVPRTSEHVAITIAAEVVQINLSTKYHATTNQPSTTGKA
jgi:xanthine/CO dehydrogenase XdhC/CoxF family maturation factor